MMRIRKRLITMRLPTIWLREQLLLNKSKNRLEVSIDGQEMKMLII